MTTPYLKFDDVQKEKSKRHLSKKKVPAIQYSFASTGNPNYPTASPEGTATFYIGRKGSTVLKQIKESALKNESLDKNLFQKLMQQFSRRKVVTMDEAVKTIIDKDTIVDIKYNNITLFGDLILCDDLDVAIFTLPFAGGAIDTEIFSISSYKISKTTEDLEGVVILNSPKLSKAESAALKKIQPGMEKILFGDTSPVSWCPAVAVVATVITVATICFHRKLTEIHIPTDRIKNQLPEFTAIELLDIRKKLLTGELI